MKREIYVMFDSVSGAFGEPFTLANEAELRREFEQMIRNPAIPDYALRDVVILQLGTFVQDADHPHIVPFAVATPVLRGGTYNVQEIRGQISSVSAAASELPSE